MGLLKGEASGCNCKCLAGGVAAAEDHHRRSPADLGGRARFAHESFDERPRCARAGDPYSLGMRLLPALR